MLWPQIKVPAGPQLVWTLTYACFISQEPTELSSDGSSWPDLVYLLVSKIPIGTKPEHRTGSTKDSPKLVNKNNRQCWKLQFWFYLRSWEFWNSLCITKCKHSQFCQFYIVIFNSQFCDKNFQTGNDISNAESSIDLQPTTVIEGSLSFPCHPLEKTILWLY